MYVCYNIEKYNNLFILGVFTDVLNYVLQHTKDGIACPGRTKIVAVNPEHIPAYVECLKLLKALAHGNAAVQKT